MLMKKGIVLYHAYKNRVKSQFDELKEYLLEMDYLLQEKKSHFMQECKPKEQNSSFHKKDFIIELIDEEYFKYEYSYAKVLYNSSFVTAYSLFESFFLKLCEHAKYQKNIKLNVNDVSGKGIKQYKLFLNKVVGVDFTPFQTEWQEIRDYNKIRNYIVHNRSSIIKDSNRELQQQEDYFLVKKSIFLKIENEKFGTFYIDDKNYIIDFCALVNNFLLQMLESIWKLEWKTLGFFNKRRYCIVKRVVTLTP